MFRLDEERVVDATLSGGLARYINHSCNPNCTTEIVEVDREVRIIIFAKRRINRGEEVSYLSSTLLYSHINIVFVHYSYLMIINLILRTNHIKYPVCVVLQIAANG